MTASFIPTNPSPLISPFTGVEKADVFNIPKKNYSMVSRIIGEAIQAKAIKIYDVTSTSKKDAKYVPFWA